MKPLAKASESIMMRMLREDFERGNFDPTTTLPFRVIARIGLVRHTMMDTIHVQYAFPWLQDIPHPHGHQAEGMITMLLAEIERYQKLTKARVTPFHRKQLAKLRKKPKRRKS